MFMLYKGLKWAYVIGATIIALPFLIGVAFTDAAVFWYPVVIVALAILALVLESKARQRLRALQTDLLFQCKAKEYIYAYEKLLSRPAARRQKIRRFLRFDMAAGYDALGDHRHAVQLAMEFLPINTKTKRGQQQWLVYCNNMAVYYLHAGDIENTENALADMRKALSVTNKTSANYVFCYNNLLQIETYLAVLCGEGAGVRKTLEIEYNNADCPFKRVGACRLLAQVCLEAGETDKASAYLEEMVQIAGDTRHGPWARAKLQELRG